MPSWRSPRQWAALGAAVALLWLALWGAAALILLALGALGFR